MILIFYLCWRYDYHSKESHDERNSCTGDIEMAETVSMECFVSHMERPSLAVKLLGSGARLGLFRSIGLISGLL